MYQPLRIFIGYDSKEPIAFHVLAHSILRRASRPVTITPLVQPALRSAGLYARERGKTESTEFSMTRFLVPYLAGYTGDAIFMDCDMLCLTDICAVMDGRRTTTAAVSVCQHDYQPTATMKFLNQANVPYPRKNWSSFMVFDCGRCTALTPERVNTLSGLELHRFLWLNDQQIGALPVEWNWLVGEYPIAKTINGGLCNTYAAGDCQVFHPIKMLHYTLGGPWFADYENCDHADLWFAERDSLLQSTDTPFLKAA